MPRAEKYLRVLLGLSWSKGDLPVNGTCEKHVDKAHPIDEVRKQ